MQLKNTKEKKWLIKFDGDADSSVEIAKIAESLNIHPIVTKLLYSRGYRDKTAVKNFIQMESEILCNPFEMKDMDKAVDRIRLAINSGQKITVYGDYDVDGVTSVCTLYLYLKSIGADVNYYIPNRVGEGYGVSAIAIDSLKNCGTELIITVDTGTTAIEEIEYAKTVNLDFVVTDHHECRAEIPNACAVINPHRPDCQYPFKELAGVGVVFKLISAYEERVCKKSKKEAAYKIFSEYADLVAIGTIADVMPITDENRIIVSYGLKMIENTSRPGLIALIDAISHNDSLKYDKPKKPSKITSGYIGYTLAPRINAAGRIRSATVAVELFLASDTERAKYIAKELCDANKERQAEENKIIEEAYEKINGINIEETPVIVLDADTWHHGVIGIVASRITEKYSRPSILVSFEGNVGTIPSPNDVGKGSGRSIKGLNLVDALINCSDLLLKFGGHELAAGLSITRSELDNFRSKINEYAKKNLCNEDMLPVIEADCVIDFADLSIQLAQQLQQMEPYGVGNPVPAFIIKGAWVNEIISVSSGKHTRFILSDGNNTVTAMYFSNSPDSLNICNGDKVDILFNIDINEWLGKKSVQLIIRDIKRSAEATALLENSKMRFYEIWNGGFFSPEEDILPTRDDFVTVYKFIVASSRVGLSTFSHRELLLRISRGAEAQSIGYIKLKMIIRILQELNLLGIDEFEEEVYRFTVKYSPKTNLDKSNLLRRLRTQQRKI